MSNLYTYIRTAKYGLKYQHYRIQNFKANSFTTKLTIIALPIYPVKYDIIFYRWIRNITYPGIKNFTYIRE